MSEVTRQKVIAGNWKMYHGPVETGAWIRAFVKQPLPADRTVILIPPAISIPAATDALSRHSDIRVGVQNIYWEENGAFTGETSARMAAGAGATYRLPALIGEARAKELLFTGRRVDAEEALRIGLVNRVVADPAELLPTAHGLLDEMAKGSALALRLTKMAVDAPAAAHPQLDLLSQAVLFEDEEKHRRMTEFLDRRRAR